MKSIRYSESMYTKYIPTVYRERIFLEMPVTQCCELGYNFFAQISLEKQVVKEQNTSKRPGDPRAIPESDILNNTHSQPPYRILYIDHTAKMSGGEIALLNMIRALDKKIFAPVVVLFTDGELASELKASNIEVHILPLSKQLLDTRKDSLGVWSIVKLASVMEFVKSIKYLIPVIKSIKPSIVHTNSLKSDLVGGIAAKFCKVPLIWHIRDRIEKDYLPTPVVLAFRFLARFLPNLVVANSQSTLDTLHLPSSTKSGVVHSGIVLPPEPPEREWNSPVKIGIVGRIARWKGQHIFIKAAQKVHAAYPDTEFKLIGSPMFGEDEYSKEISAMVEEYGMQDCVEYQGFRADIMNAVNDLDILVHASISAEPFGQVIVEGMALKKPVVATAGGGVLEIVKDGTTGLLVPMNDAEVMANALCSLLADRDKARKMGKCARDRVVEKFTVPQTAKQMEQLYKGLLKI